MEKIVVFDGGMPAGAKNKLFERDFGYAISHTLLPLWFLVEEAKKEGIMFVTPDVFLDNPTDFVGKQVLLMSHLTHPDTETLIARGAQPFLLTCQESPFIATRFYMKLKYYSGLFRYSMLFPGMEKRVSKKTQFIPMFFPQYFANTPFEQVPFASKKFITYIASNKETKDLVKTWAIKLMYGLRVQLIYAIRRKIIHFLSKRNDFDLFGRGWNNDKEAYIQKVYRGGVDDKEKKLREYKFVLSLENAVFPGYITEKIFDAFFAGTVPVYIGAPDITTYLPGNTFININDFKNLDELERFMDAIDEVTYNEYLHNIQAFLRSESYMKWSHQRFAETVIGLIKSA